MRRILPGRPRLPAANHPVGETADVLDLGDDSVSRLHELRRVPEEPDASRRAGGDDVAGMKGDRPGDRGD